MSGAATPLAVVAVREPVTNIGAPPVYGIIDGAETVAWQLYPASSVSNTNLQISATQPNRSTMIDRRVWLQVTADFSITGTAPGGGVPLLDIGVSDALRAYPLTSVISSMTMKIGGKSVTVGSMDQFWPQLLRYHNPIAQRDTDYSVTPSMMDQYQEYAQGLGSNRNPLAGYGSNSAEMSRGGFTQALITSLVNPAPALAGTVTATFSVTLQEPLFLSPFIFARGDNEPALIGVDNFNFTATFDPLARMWSRFNVPGGSSVSPLVAGQGVNVTLRGAGLLFRQLTPKVTVGIPRNLAYSYFNPVLYQQQASGAIGAGAQTTLTSSVITLPGIPRRIYIWASERFADQSFLTSDTMFSIDQVTLKWGTNTYLREATPLDLYNISVKNGVNLSWPQWRSFTGGILCLEMGSDIGLKATEAAGSDGKYQMQVILQATNLNGTRAILPNLNVVAVQEGVVEIRDGTVYIIENPVMARDVLDARAIAGITYKKSESIYGGGIVGGSFFGDILSGIKTAAKYAGQAIDVVAPVARFIPGVGSTISAGLAAARPVLGAIGGRRPKAAMGKSRRAIRARLRGMGLADEEDTRSLEEGLEEDYEEEPVARAALRGRSAPPARDDNVGSSSDDDDAVSEYLRGGR